MCLNGYLFELVIYLNGYLNLFKLVMCLDIKYFFQCNIEDYDSLLSIKDLFKFFYDGICNYMYIEILFVQNVYFE